MSKTAIGFITIYLCR